MKILLTDIKTIASNNDLTAEEFSKLGEICVYELIDRKTFLEIVSDFDIIICNKTIIDREVMEKAVKLKYIGLFATGYNNIDISCAKEKGICVCNAGIYSTNAVVQQTFGYILSFYSKIDTYDGFVKDGGWINSDVFSPIVFPTDEIYGKTLGIIGYGSIGRAVEKVALAFGMKVIVNTRTIKENGETEFLELDELLKRADIVSLHCPLSERNTNMFNRETFDKFKDGAYFINTARGGLVDENALAQALETDKLKGAAVDVLKTEPMEEDCPLKSAKNIIITPHTAWAPYTTRRRLLDIVISNLKGFLDGKKQNVIV